MDIDDNVPDPSILDGDDDEGEQIRVSFTLDSGVSDRSLEVPSEPIAVPSSVRRRGLSAVINHLLDRKVEEVDGSSDEESDGDEAKLPAIPFDFLVNGRLLRTGVEAVARREGLSLERAVEIRYFPAAKAPSGSGESETLPDWVTAMTYSSGGADNATGALCTGCADGSIHVFEASSAEFNDVDTIGAHTGPVKCVSSSSYENGCILASGSMDQTLLTHVLDAKNQKLTLHAVYSGGHSSSICGVSLLRRSDGNAMMVSGDWDGGLSVWKVPSIGGSGTNDGEAMKKKKQKTSSSAAATVSDTAVEEVQPESSWKAHASNVSGIAYSHDSRSKNVITGSWDHSLKCWDIERQDCILTLNGSRVVTSLGRCHNSDVVATGHPDCTVRLWDMRFTKGGSTSSAVSDSTLKPSHKAWVSAIQWSPTDPYLLATTSHDGTVKMWDIRSSLPLHSVRAHPKGEKGLCLAYSDGVIYSGGSDCVVKRFMC